MLCSIYYIKWHFFKFIMRQHEGHSTEENNNTSFRVIEFRFISLISEKYIKCFREHF